MTYASRHPASPKAKASHSVYVLESRGVCDGQGGNEAEGGCEEHGEEEEEGKEGGYRVHSLAQQQHAQGICVDI